MKYLKWKDEVIAQINSDNSVDFINNNVAAFTNPDIKDTHWSPERFAKFLDDRIVSRQRRDIEKILFRCGLSSYDVFKIAERTKAINAKDLLWIANNENDTFDNAFDDVFNSIFIKKMMLRAIVSIALMVAILKDMVFMAASTEFTKTDYILFLPTLRVKLLYIN